MSRRWQEPVLEGLEGQNLILAFTGTIQKVQGRSLEGQLDQVEHIRAMFSGSNWLGRHFAGTGWFRELKVSRRGDWHVHVNFVFLPKDDLDREGAAVLAQRVLDRWSEKAELAGARTVQTQNAEDLVLGGRGRITSWVDYASKTPAWDHTGLKYNPSWTYADLLNHALAGQQLGIPNGDWALELMHEAEVATSQRPGRRSAW